MNHGPTSSIREVIKSLNLAEQSFAVSDLLYAIIYSFFDFMCTVFLEINVSLNFRAFRHVIIT